MELTQEPKVEAKQLNEKRYAMMVTERDLAAIARSRWWSGNGRTRDSWIMTIIGIFLIAAILFAPLVWGTVATVAFIVGAIYLSWRVKKSQKQVFDELKKELT